MARGRMLLVDVYFTATSDEDGAKMVGDERNIRAVAVHAEGLRALLDEAEAVLKAAGYGKPVVTEVKRCGDVLVSARPCVGARGRLNGPPRA